MTDSAGTIANGRLAKQGLLSAEAVSESADLVKRVADSEIETVRVLFADQHGVLRGKTIVANALESIFASGMAAPSTLLLKDTSHRTTFPVWASDAALNESGMSGAGDILMVPDPATYRILPWSPHSAWVLCDTKNSAGESLAYAPRDVLKNSIALLAEQKKKLMVGLEIEFHVFDIVDSALNHQQSTMPGQPVKTRNLTQGYQFLTETRYGALESIMDELRRYCQSLHLPIRTMEIEMGPSQFEFTFDPADPLTHADNMMMLRTMVKEVCTNRGLHATFMCRPKIENTAASGWHLHQSVVDSVSNTNLMIPLAGKQMTNTAGAWIAGLLEHAAESCLLTTPTVNGYKRYMPHQLAPDKIQWGRDNRGAMIRALLKPGDTASRIENRVGEPTANPYYFFASQILSGLDGLNRKLQVPEAVETPYDCDANALPGNLLEAIQLFDSSKFYRATLGDSFVDYLCRIKQAEWDRYNLVVSEWEQIEYFGLY